MTTPLIGPDGLPYWEKDPDAKLDYTIDWTDWLASAGNDTIAVSTWTVPAGLTHGSPADSLAGAQATVWASGGTKGTKYTLTNQITTAGGRVEQRSIVLVIKNR